MDWIDSFVNNIPALLMYIIPGFIALKIRESFGPYEKHEELISVLYCFLYSYIVLMVYYMFRALVGTFIPNLENWPLKETIKVFILLCFGVLEGIVIAKVPKLKIAELFIKLINRHATKDDPWEKAMINDSGAYATVYLKDGLIYEGTLRYYTLEPYAPKKCIVLTNYNVFASVADDPSHKKRIGPDISSAIISKWEKLNPQKTAEYKVLLKWDDILSIEVDPITAFVNQYESKQAQKSESTHEEKPIDTVIEGG